eukprot:s604_g21.t1
MGTIEGPEEAKAELAVGDVLVPAQCASRSLLDGRSGPGEGFPNGHTLLTSHLLHRRAIVEKCDTSGNSPLHYALAYGWQDRLALAGVF